MNNQQVNDGRWHEIKIERRSSTTTLTVDRRYRVIGFVHRECGRFQKGNQLLIGGDVIALSGVVTQAIDHPFVGCINQLAINEQSVPYHDSTQSGYVTLKKAEDLSYSCDMSPPEHICATALCQNGGKCEVTNTVTKKYQCLCPEPFQGDLCQFNKDDATGSLTTKQDFDLNLNQPKTKSTMKDDILERQATKPEESPTVKNIDKELPTIPKDNNINIDNTKEANLIYTKIDWIKSNFIDPSISFLKENNLQQVLVVVFLILCSVIVSVLILYCCVYRRKTRTQDTTFNSRRRNNDADQGNGILGSLVGNRSTQDSLLTAQRGENGDTEENESLLENGSAKQAANILNNNNNNGSSQNSDHEDTSKLLFGKNSANRRQELSDASTFELSSLQPMLPKFQQESEEEETTPSLMLPPASLKPQSRFNLFHRNSLPTTSSSISHFPPSLPVTQNNLARLLETTSSTPNECSTQLTDETTITQHLRNIFDASNSGLVGEAIELQPRPALIRTRTDPNASVDVYYAAIASVNASLASSPFAKAKETEVNKTVIENVVIDPDEATQSALGIGPCDENYVRSLLYEKQKREIGIRHLNYELYKTVFKNGNNSQQQQTPPLPTPSLSSAKLSFIDRRRSESNLEKLTKPACLTSQEQVSKQIKTSLNEFANSNGKHL